MTFNFGYLCGVCGPIETALKNKCPVCVKPVTKWERPINERSGRCRTCTGAHFKSKIDRETHHLIRTCRNCNEIYNIDTEKVMEKGILK